MKCESHENTANHRYIKAVGVENTLEYFKLWQILTKIAMRICYSTEYPVCYDTTTGLRFAKYISLVKL
jgi:hypothetical protein